MATINSLAPETLRLFLELAVEPSRSQFRQRDTLAAAALVARRWRAPAQALLWRKLDIWHPGAVKRMLESPVCGKFRTFKVTMDPTDFTDGVTAGGVLGKLKGVEEFWVWSYKGGGIDASWFNFASLADLRSLYIAAEFLSETIPVDIHPSFHLRSLEFGHINSASIIYSLFATSASSLISLTLDLNYTIMPTLLSGLLTSLPLVAHHLESLILKDFAHVPGLSAVVSTFTSLTSLSLHINNTSRLLDTDEFLSHFTPPPRRGFSLLLSLWVAHGGDHAGFDEGFGGAVLARLGRSKAWEGLGAVQVRDTQEELETDVRGKEFLRRCAEKGIKVTPAPTAEEEVEEEEGKEEEE